MKSTRPVLRWFGGKWVLAPWILSHFPPHRIYVEPFGGGASLLLRKKSSYAEVYNDLDGDVVNLFQVLRGPQAADLVRAIDLTPFARAEFEASYRPVTDPLERARSLVIKSFMGFGSNAHNPARKTGFRNNSNRSGTTPAHDWRNYPDALVRIIDRLRGVTVENRDAKSVMADHDGPRTLHYIDPPYVWATRSPSRPNNPSYGGYVHEMSDGDHRALLEFILTLDGMVVISGYRHPLYDELLAGWARSDKQSLANGAKARLESLWSNAAAVEQLANRQLTMLDAA